MPRRGRIKSETGIYHVMLRGINQQVIFEDDEDYEKMLQTLSDVKAISNFEMYAYCLMPNHCHFLLKDGHESLEQIFRRIGSRYVYWYNLKYKRVGHLFQDRYKRETIENEKQLLAVLRYIHQNPIKGGLCSQLSDYTWSSYNEYLGKQKIVDTKDIFEIIERKAFEDFSKSESNEKVLDDEPRGFRVSDTEAKARITKISGCDSTTAFQKLELSVKRKYLKEFKDAGISIRQINRLTGISKGIVERA